MPLRRLLTVLVALAVSTAAAVATPMDISASNVVKSLTDAAIEALGFRVLPPSVGLVAPASFLAPVASLGSKILWHGGLLATSLLISDGLNWLYEEAKRQSGSAVLDDWRTSGIVLPLAPPTDMTLDGQTVSYGGRDYCYSYDPSGHPVRGYSYGYFSDTPRWGHLSGIMGFSQTQGWYPIAISAHDITAASSGYVCTGGQVTPPSLGQLMKDSPSTVPFIRQVISDYATAHPERLRLPTNRDLTNPLSSAVTLQPAPNPNQEYDSPSADFTIDTDGDGTPDHEEVFPSNGAPATDPNNPASHPELITPGVAVSVGSQGERITTTTHPNGTKTRVTVSSSSVRGDLAASPAHPFGATSTVATITTLTEELDASNRVTSTRTADEVTPAVVTDKVLTDEQTCTAGGGTFAAGQCAPKADNCPEGQQAGSDGVCAPKVVDPGDMCGDFGLARALHHPASYLRDVFVPCESVADLIAPSLLLLKTKFPFSLAASLNGWFAGAGSASAGGVTALPVMLGPIPLEWGWLSSLWGLIKTLVGVALWSWFIYWLVDRFTPRTEI